MNRWHMAVVGVGVVWARVRALSAGSCAAVSGRVSRRHAPNFDCNDLLAKNSLPPRAKGLLGKKPPPSKFGTNANGGLPLDPPRFPLALPARPKLRRDR